MKNDGQASTGVIREIPVYPKFDLDGWWWAMVVLGFLIIGFFGFCFCIETTPFRSGVAGLSRAPWHVVPPFQTMHCIAHWRSWEMGAVIWSILFGGYYFVRFPLPNEASIKAICLLIFIGATIPNMLAAYFILALKPAVFHVSAVILGAILFVLVDFLLFKKLVHHRQRGSFLEGLLMADLPVVAGLSILLFYLRVHSSPGDRHEDMEAFAGGAISFQLIASNVIFILSQGGFIRWVWESHVPKYIDTIKIEPTPLGQNPWAGTALMCGLCGAIVALIRRFDGSGSPWLLRVGLVTLIAAIGAGIYGRRAARRLAGAGEGPANTAVALGAVGLVCLALLPPPCGMFSGERLIKLPDPDSGGVRVTSVALSPDGSELARGSDTDETVKVIDTGTGKPNPDLSFRPGGPVLALAYSADGKMLASGGKGLKVMLWDAETGRLLGTLGDKRHRDDLGGANDILCLAFSPDGALLAGGGKDGTIYLWDTQGQAEEPGEPKSTLTHDNAVRALAFSADGKWLAGGGDAVTVLLWKIKKEWLMADGEDKRELSAIRTEEPFRFRGFDGRGVFSLAVSQDGDAVAAGFNDGSVRLWKRKEQGTWALPKAMEKPGGQSVVLALLFSADAGMLASAAANSGVVLWDTQSDTMRPLAGAGEAATAIAFSPDGRTVASGSLDGGTVSVWRPE